MAWTRTEYMEEVRNIMDADGSGRWTDGTIRRHLGLVHQQLWREILDANNTYRKGTRTVYPDTDGLVPLRDLNGGSGDTLERFYRILTDHHGNGGVVRGEVLYREGVFAHTQTAGATSAWSGSGGMFLLDGSNLQVYPKVTDELTVYVSHTPARIDELSGDGITAEFPEGYELAVAYRAAALLLAKGGAEDDAGATMLALSQNIMGDLIGTIE